MEYRKFALTAEKVAKKIDLGVHYWPNHPKAVCLGMLQNRIITGRVVHGIYRGPIHPRSQYQRLANDYYWIETEDGIVIDPIRWALECSFPYIREFDPGEAEEFGYQEAYG